jgi:hypothetical protein
MDSDPSNIMQYFQVQYFENIVYLNFYVLLKCNTNVLLLYEFSDTLNRILTFKNVTVLTG